MKKIVFFIDNLGPGGAQRQIVNLAILLKEAGYDVSMLVYGDIPFYKPLLDEKNVPTILVGAKSNLSRLVNVRKYLNKSSADVVVAFLETPCFIAGFSRMGHKKWKLITNELSAKMSTFTSKKNRIYNMFEHFSNAKVGNSVNAMRMWKKYYPQYNDKYSVIYNPVIISEEYVMYEHEYLKDGKVRLCVAASYQKLKNPLGVIEAVNKLSDEQKEKLVIDWYGRAEVTTGNTEIYDKAVKLIEEYSLKEVIHLHGETSEIYRIMAQSDAVGLFSTVEGLPNTICEAMTIGRPVVMSKVSDYDVLVTDNGYLCEAESVESIKEALAELLTASKEELKRMGEGSKQKAKELFSAEAIRGQWIEIIERLTK